MNYKVLKNFTRIGDKEYMIGDIIDGNFDYPFDVAISFGFIEPCNTPIKQVKSATIEKSGIWFKVIDDNGDIIGKATRNEDEAKEIKAFYEKT